MSAAFTAIAAMVKSKAGLVLGPDKIYLAETRLAPLMKSENVADLAALAAKLRPDSSLERAVIEAMTTNESLFFRDTKPFDALRLRLLLRLHETRPPGAPIRIWSAAAATGQEAWSIAMVAYDLALANRRVDIVGTDIAREPLQRARDGIYTQFEIQRGVPMQMLVKHFEKADGNWRIKPHLRANVSFREWNLLADPAPLGRFDIVFCRNVLIYFDTPTKSRVLNALARLMPKDGALFLGGAETVLGLSAALRAVPGEPGAYAPI